MKQLKVSSALKKGFFCLLVPSMFPAKHLHAQLSGYTYAKTITIPAAQVSGSLTNFPVLVSFTDNALRTVANGGHVQNASGYDIVFTMGDCNTILSHQIESYTATNGQYVAWVRVPLLTSVTNNTLHMFYGNSSVTTNPSTTAVWDANYMGVWHFNNSVNDASSNSRHLTNNSTTNLTTGKIGEARELNNSPFVASNSGSLKYLRLPSNLFSGVTSFSFEGWVWTNDNTTNWERIFDFGRTTTENMFLTPSIENTTNGIKRFAITTTGNGSEQRISSTTSTGTGGWHYFVVTIDDNSNTGTLYYDGTVNAINPSMTLGPSNLYPDNANYFGRSQYNADHGLYGYFDEFRISSTARSADWVATSYRNQNNAAGFYSVSSELVAATICSSLPVKLSSFEAAAEQDGSASITWVTQHETNNEKFILEKSANGNSWEVFKTIAAAGNSVTSQKYFVQDKNPLYPVTYYRLKQTDNDNTATYSGAVMVKFNPGENTGFVVSPNPATQQVKIAFREYGTAHATKIELVNNMGIKIPVQPVVNGNNITVALTGMANGIYFLNVYNKGKKYSQRLLILQ
jgi:biopolymer transport protein ExbB